MYQSKLQQLGIKTDEQVKLLSHYAGMTAKLHGEDIRLVFDEDKSEALSNVC